jgi:hypothetical protein
LEARSEDATSLPHLNGKGDNPAADMPLPRSRLKFAMRRARFDEAERSEVIAELRGAEIARLEMLKEEVAPVLAEVPPDVDFFDFGLVPGEHPRLFIDMIAFVEMGRDRRVYSFVQDTRHGRVTLAESERLEPMVEAITNYVARRLIEREKALAAEATIAAAARLQAPDATPPKPAVAPPSGSFLSRALVFLTEAVGSAVLVALVAIGAREVWKYALAWWMGE